MTLIFFEILLHEYDEIYLTGPPSPPRSRSGSIDTLPFWNKYDGFGDVRPHLEKSKSTILKIDRSPQHDEFGDIKPLLGKSDPVMKIDRSSHVKKELVDSVLEKVRAD